MPGPADPVLAVGVAQVDALLLRRQRLLLAALLRRQLEREVVQERDRDAARAAIEDAVQLVGAQGC